MDAKQEEGTHFDLNSMSTTAFSILFLIPLLDVFSFSQSPFQYEFGEAEPNSKGPCGSIGRTDSSLIKRRQRSRRIDLTAPRSCDRSRRRPSIIAGKTSWLRPPLARRPYPMKHHEGRLLNKIAPARTMKGLSDLITWRDHAGPK